MNNKIETYSSLSRLIDLDQSDHKLKNCALLFFNAMDDWPSHEIKIADFVKELKDYFGSSLITEKIKSIKFSGQNAWQIEAGSSIVEIINTSTDFFNESDFDNIIKNIIEYYENESFSKKRILPTV